MGNGPSFFSKSAFKKHTIFAQRRMTFGFLDWRMPDTHGICVGRV
jgi:hypothetical protein